MTAKKKTAKKKTAKKTGKALAKQEYSNTLGGGVLAQARPAVPLPDALKAFDAALEKVKGIRSILTALNEEVTANRARRLADAVSNLQHHAWALQQSAYAEADK